MNKGQLVEAVAGTLGSRAAAEDAVDAVLDAMVRAVVAGDRVQVTGFGTLEPVQRSARTARNPQTGEKVRVKRSTVPRFRPGQGFRDLVSGARKLPKTGPSIMKAPKGSLTPGKTTAAAPAAKRAAARRTSAAAQTVVAKKTTVKKTATAKKATAKKTTAWKTTAAAKTTAPARKTTTAKTTAPERKTVAAKKTAPAKRTTRRAAK